MPTCYQLVGVPGSGKTTWIKQQSWASECVIASSDDFIEKEARRRNKTYSEVFDEYFSTANDLMMDLVGQAKQQKQDIIWDQTSTTVKSRKRKFSILPNYRHIAVVFKTPPKEELERRLSGRPGKHIPDFIMQNMIKNFQYPSLQEGFAEIWNV